MWNNNKSEGCIYDTVDCTYCNGYGKLDRMECESFGNPESDVGSCIDCCVENKELWERCMQYKNQL